MAHHPQVIHPTVIRRTTRRITGAASTTTGNSNTQDSAQALSQRPAKASLNRSLQKIRSDRSSLQRLRRYCPRPNR